jgi:zinc D-Ala-D-Ala carboxypeptidase
MTTKLSTNFTLEEALHSQTAVRKGISNTPSSEHLANIKLTALSMEIVRTVLTDKPILVSSWYRSPEVNTLVGGAIASQHSSGEAVDFICPGYGTPYLCCMRLREFREVLNYDQLIYEGSWVHISFLAVPNRIPRKQELTYMLDRTYKLGLHETRK